MEAPIVTRGVDILLTVLREEGVSLIFGNPGSTEMPLIDALVDCDDVKYVLALQEASAVGMADGHAQALRRASFVNLHTAGGIGNAMGAIINAKATNTPMVITAGQQDSRHLLQEPWLSGDLVALARPVTKWAHEVRSVDEIGPALRRAFQLANAHPRGPVFLSLPMDALAAETEAGLPPRSPEARLPAGEISGIAAMMDALEPQEIALILSDVVDHEDAMREAVAVADASGCRVYGAPLLGSNVFPASHRAWRGTLPPDHREIRRRLTGNKLVVMVGGHALLAYPYRDVGPIPDGARFVQIANTTDRFGFDHPTAASVFGGVKATLEALARAVAASGARDAERDRLDLEQRSRAAELEARLDALAGGMPLHPSAAVRAVLEVLPEGIPIVNEASCTFDTVREQWQSTLRDRYYFVRGGGLGFGMPAAVGVSLAGGLQPVACLIGDGAAMYSPQALWSAANCRVPVTFIVFNNRRYDILTRVSKGLGFKNALADRFVGMMIDEPAIDFRALAGTAGLDYRAASRAEDIGTHLRAAIGSGRPSVLEIGVTGL